MDNDVTVMGEINWKNISQEYIDKSGRIFSGKL
jgi:hypothetical protein